MSSEHQRKLAREAYEYNTERLKKDRARLAHYAGQTRRRAVIKALECPKVYRIVCNDTEVQEVYIGSTEQPLASRFSDHRSSSNTNNKPIPAYDFIKDNGGWDNWRIELLEETDADQRYECEQKWIDLHASVLNVRPAFGYVRQKQKAAENSPDNSVSQG